jgi:hypothetical protein
MRSAFLLIIAIATYFLVNFSSCMVWSFGKQMDLNSD